MSRQGAGGDLFQVAQTAPTHPLLRQCSGRRPSIATRGRSSACESWAGGFLPCARVAEEEEEGAKPARKKGASFLPPAESAALESGGKPPNTFRPEPRARLQRGSGGGGCGALRSGSRLAFGQVQRGRYGGYCPRYKFTLGRTYGKLTSQLLAAPSRSGRLLLQPNCSLCAAKERPGHGRGSRDKGCSAIPGYTGFIPRAQHHFAKTYGEICRQAWLEFMPQQEQGDRGRGQAKETTKAPQLENRPLPALPKTGTAAAAAATPAFRAPGTPLALERTFVSGFTGFVPRLQFLIGASYPILARRATMEFDEMLHKTGQGSSQRGDPLPPLAKTYPTDRGLLPHYRGFVPGYKFQFGHTYGHLTHDALGQTTLEKQVLDVTQ